jgi:acetate kinase
MRILCLNCGTSTLRFDLADSDHGYGEPVRLAQGMIEGIGSAAQATLAAGTIEFTRPVVAASHEGAFDTALKLLNEAAPIGRLDAISHRVVQGGLRMSQAAIIDESVIEAIDEASDLAALHNHAALKVIKAAGARFPGVPMVAAFDTTFFLGLPEVATRYALPRQISDSLGIRRFGAQGLAHHYMVERYRALHPRLSDLRLITLQLGADCSVTASIDGRPIDTSMGFTLLEGLIMGTRSGDIDPSIPLHLVRKGGLSPDEVWTMLNTQSGILGLSGGAADFKELTQRAVAGDKDAELAFEAFCLSAKKYVGAYLALLGGANAIIFGGGIGEHSAEARSRICEGLEFAGVALDERWNQLPPGERVISPDDSPVKVWVMRVDEAAVMVSEVVRVLGQRS